MSTLFLFSYVESRNPCSKLKFQSAIRNFNVNIYFTFLVPKVVYIQPK